jgi:hypothetical protein
MRAAKEDASRLINKAIIDIPPDFSESCSAPLGGWHDKAAGTW